MINRQQRIANMLSNILTIIVAIVFLGSAYFFITGQISANHALVEAGEAVVKAVERSDAQEAVDYAGAITYLEAAQQAYSDNNAIKITSLLYTLATTIILGYGAKILRLGATTKKELCEEILNMTEQQLEKNTTQMLQSQAELQTAITACENATHLCSLLRSHIGLSMQMNEVDNNGKVKLTPTMERFEVELTQSLQRFRDFLAVYQESGNNFLLGQGGLVLIRQSWIQAERTIHSYSIDYLGKVFDSFDKSAIDRMVQEIQDFIKILH